MVQVQVILETGILTSPQTNQSTRTTVVRVPLEMNRPLAPVLVSGHPRLCQSTGTFHPRGHTLDRQREQSAQVLRPLSVARLAPDGQKPNL